MVDGVGRDRLETIESGMVATWFYIFLWGRNGDGLTVGKAVSVRTGPRLGPDLDEDYDGAGSASSS